MSRLCQRPWLLLWLQLPFWVTLSGELGEADESEASLGHQSQCLVLNTVAETLSPQERNVIPCNQWVVILVSLHHLKSGRIIRSSISGQRESLIFFFSMFYHPGVVIIQWCQLESIMKAKFGNSYRMCYCYWSKATGLFLNTAPLFDLFFLLIEQSR